MQEDLGIEADAHERRISIILHPAQLLAELVREHRLLDLHLQTRVRIGETIEYRLPHRLEHLVLRSLTALLHPLHGRLQRVGGDLCHHLGSQQLSLHQLTVGFLLLGLRHNLLQNSILRPRQVLVLRRRRFLPEFLVCLTK